MTYKIIIYCPDRHILYHATTPDKEGVGGGIVARIRLAQNLAKLGHEVTLISNVSQPHVSQGATFLPLEEADKRREADVLLMMSSGDKLSLQSANSLPIESRLREVWVQGTLPIAGIEELNPDYIVAPSNFNRNVVKQEWQLSEEKLFVIYNGLTQLPSPKKWWKSEETRDPNSLIYFSHPSKGLDAAIAVLRLLRQQDTSFSLHVFGGNALWGGEDGNITEPGLIYHGTKGQKEVFQYLQKTNFSLHLQAREEPFGMVVTESMSQGCIPIASPVGAFPETIHHGINGFLISGDHQKETVHQKTAELILKTVQVPDYLDYIRHIGQNIPWTWENQSRVFAQHWSWELDQEGITMESSDIRCPSCGGSWLLTADGYHCLDCGLYSQEGQ